MLHPFEENVRRFIEDNRLIEYGDRILVAVSGGPDSVALLHVLYSLRSQLGIQKLAVAHFNHGLRGQDAEEDAHFVKLMAADLKLSVIVGEGNTESHRRRHRISLETAAREQRQRFLKRTAITLHCSKTAVGHTANDQAEEILLRLFRGVGPGGLKGMEPRTSLGIIRPLLAFERQEILTYLHDSSLDYRIDQTNLLPFCRRNIVRLRILTEAEKAFSPQVVRTLSRFARLTAIEEQWWNHHLNEQWGKFCAHSDKTEVILDAEALRDAHKAVRYRVIRRALEKLLGSCYGFGAKHVIAVEQLAIKRPSGRSLDLPRGVQATKEYQHLILAHRLQQLQGFSWVISRPGRYMLGPFYLSLELLDSVGSPLSSTSALPANTVLLDADSLQWPLFIRSRQPGDWFRPWGGPGRKKLKKYLNERRIPRRHRNTIPLLCDQTKICWVVGHQVDERVGIRSHTRRLLRVTIDRIKDD